MTGRDSPGQEPTGPQGRFADDLIGLDPGDPEVRDFADHLDRMEHAGSALTVEGYLNGVERFADSANRTGGLRRHFTVAVVGLILLGVLAAAWDVVTMIADTFFN